MLVTISDKRILVNGAYEADVITANDYYSFGSEMPGRTYAASNSTSAYGMNGQQKDDEIAKGLYTAKYWEYDSRIGRRWNLDPKPTMGISDYAVFNNNPISTVDLLGDKPSPREAAAMAAHVYGDKKDRILKGNWKVSQKQFGIVLEDKASGFRSAVYERLITSGEHKGETEYAYVTVGTEGLSGKDWKNNIQQPLGLSKQYRLSMNNANSLDKQIGADLLTFVGHSLGGGEAVANAYATGRNAITFNAAGVSPFTIRSNAKSKIDAYILRTDPLNGAQNSWSGLGLVMPNVDGTKHYLWPKDFPSVYNGHSIDNILKVFEINPDIYKLKPSPPPYDPNVIRNMSDLRRETNRWMSW